MLSFTDPNENSGPGERRTEPRASGWGNGDSTHPVGPAQVYTQTIQSQKGELIEISPPPPDCLSRYSMMRVNLTHKGAFNLSVAGCNDFLNLDNDMQILNIEYVKYNMDRNIRIPSPPPPTPNFPPPFSVPPNHPWVNRNLPPPCSCLQPSPGWK